MDVHIAYWVIVILAVIPMSLLLLAWLARLSPSASRTAFQMVRLLAATSSYIWMLLAMKFPVFLGESYGKSRLAITDASFLVMLGCSIAAFRGNERRKRALGLGCMLTTTVWGYWER